MRGGREHNWKCIYKKKVATRKWPLSVKRVQLEGQIGRKNIPPFIRSLERKHCPMLQQSDVRRTVQPSQCLFELHFDAPCPHTQQMFRRTPRRLLAAHARALWSRISLERQSLTACHFFMFSPIYVWKRVSRRSCSRACDGISSVSCVSKLITGSASSSDVDGGETSYCFCFLSFTGHSKHSRILLLYSFTFHFRGSAFRLSFERSEVFLF